VTNTAAIADERGLQSILINDFSPGIYDAQVVVAPSGGPAVVGPFPAPVGAADASNTVGCMNLPSGGLGPLPQMVQAHSPADFGFSTPGGATFSQYGAMFATAINGGQTGGDEIIVNQTYVDSSGILHSFTNSCLWNTLTNHALLNLTASGIPGPPYPQWPASVCYPFVTRVAPTSPTTTVGVPIVVLPVSSNFTTGFNLYLYPDPSAPTAFGTHQITTGLDLTGFAFGHQGRIVQLNTLAYRYPVTPSFGMAYFDTVSYTEPPNSDTWGNQDEVFGPENPYGYGAVTSV